MANPDKKEFTRVVIYKNMVFNNRFNKSKIHEENLKDAEASQNKAEDAVKKATEAARSAEKINIEMEKVEGELHDMDKKDEN